MFSRSTYYPSSTSASNPAAPIHFPTFLLPSLPFRRRRRQLSTDSTQSSISAASCSRSPPCSPTTALPPTPEVSLPIDDNQEEEEDFLSGHTSYLRCSRCSVDLCLTSAIVSRGFTGRWGRAYLVCAAGGGGWTTGGSSPNLPNTHTHKAVPRQLVTGAHTVSDVSCAFCGNVLGWKYVAADEESQQYKVGKFILETKRVSVQADWEGGGMGGGSGGWDMERSGRAADGEDEVEFDSQDEDECEDLFAGTWTAEGARRRRRERRW